MFSYIYYRCDNHSTCKIFVNSSLVDVPCMDMEPYLEVQYDCKKHTRKEGRKKEELINLKMESVWSNKRGLDLEMAVQAALQKDQESNKNHGRKSQNKTNREQRSFVVTESAIFSEDIANTTLANKSVSNKTESDRISDRKHHSKQNFVLHPPEIFSVQEYVMIIVISTVIVISSIIIMAAIFIKVIE